MKYIIILTAIISVILYYGIGELLWQLKNPAVKLRFKRLVIGALIVALLASQLDIMSLFMKTDEETSYAADAENSEIITVSDFDDLQDDLREETVPEGTMVDEQILSDTPESESTTDTTTQIEDAEDTEDAEDIETEADDSGNEEDLTDESENPEETEQSDKVKDEETENPEEDEAEVESEAESEAEAEDETEEETEDEEKYQADEQESGEEDCEEAVMLLSEDEVSVIAVEATADTYTDNNGIIYSYYGYNDRTANIYKVEFPGGDSIDGIPMNIPMKIAEYEITQLTFTMSSPVNFYSVTIPETITYIADNAFRSVTINELYYNAVDAETRSSSTTGGSFTGATINGLHIGKNVRALPDYLFSNATIKLDELTLDMEKIGQYAFYGSDIVIGEVTIAENITSIGKEAFGSCSITKLNYNAIEAEIPGMQVSLHHRNPFASTKVGELHIGDKVKVLPDSMFYCLILTQDELIIPDSVTDIGADTLSCANDTDGRGKMSIGTLVIGENVTHIGRGAFGAVTYDKVIIHPVNTGNELLALKGEVPTCNSVDIHGNADCYAFFTANTEPNNITLLCKEFDTTYGDEYFDEKKNSFVTTTTETCVVCGYKKVVEEYEAAITVTFVDYDGKELLKQHLHSGEDATAPDAPSREGYKFTGWDKVFTKVTSDITVTAQYEVMTFHVVFKDGENVISDQEIEYGSSATPQKAPVRPDEEWGRWQFSGWDGNYENIMKDEILQAQFEKILNKYEVIFYDAYGNSISTQSVPHGEAAKEPDAPQKESTAQYSYTFIGWDGDTGNISKNSNFHPQYKAEIRYYTVIFMNGDEILDEQSIGYGMPATAPPAPTKEADDEYTYTFSGWDKDFGCVEGNMIINAVFDKAEIDDSKGSDDEDDSKKPEDEDKPKEPEDENKPNKRKPTSKTKDNDNEPENTGDDGDIGDDPDIETLGNDVEITPETEIKVTEWKSNSGLPRQRVQKHLPDDSVSLTEDKSIETPKVNVLEEDKEEAEETEETENKEEVEETEETKNKQEIVIKEDTGNKKDSSGFKWIFSILGIIAATVFGIWFYLACFNGRKIYGTILNEDGGFMCGALLVLEKKGILGTKTDENGYFCFKNLKKGDYRLKVYHEKGWIMYSADIHMDSENKEVTFSVLESKCESVETRAEKRKYEINIKAWTLLRYTDCYI